MKYHAFFTLWIWAGNFPHHWHRAQIDFRLRGGRRYRLAVKGTHATSVRGDEQAVKDDEVVVGLFAREPAKATA